VLYTGIGYHLVSLSAGHVRRGRQKLGRERLLFRIVFLSAKPDSKIRSGICAFGNPCELFWGDNFAFPEIPSTERGRGELKQADI
jgi:hypothetical protein